MAVGLTVVKLGYRHGVKQEEWSNKYHLTGPDPTTPTAWRTLFDALVAEEKKVYSNAVSVVRGYGYDSDDPDATAVWSVDLTVAPNSPVAGALASGADMAAPSDTAVWIRWKLDRNNSRGKPIFLRKYFHDARVSSTPSNTTSDTTFSGQVTALTTFATLLFTGAGIDSGRHIRDTGGGNPIAAGVSSFVTTRTLKRRGKRP